jgi:hypothetical protein
VIVIRRIRVAPKPKIRIGRVKMAPRASRVRLGHVRIDGAAKEDREAPQKGRLWGRE